MRDDPDGPAVLAMPGVTVAGVAEVRRRVTDAARQAGLSPEHAAGFTVAVNEIVINAVEHGGGTAAVTVFLRPGRLVVEVTDGGAAPWQLRVPAAAPPPDQAHGRGLWLAARLADELSMEAGDTGLLVRLSAMADDWRATQTRAAQTDSAA